jgi:hypothetical protein
MTEKFHCGYLGFFISNYSHLNPFAKQGSLQRTHRWCHRRYTTLSEVRETLNDRSAAVNARDQVKRINDEQARF